MQRASSPEQISQFVSDLKEINRLNLEENRRFCVLQDLVLGVTFYLLFIYLLLANIDS